jgi:hypothetical protein
LGSKKEQETDALVAQHLCGWACKCLLTRVNFMIAGLCFTLALYVLSETTLFFENTAQFFTGMQPPTPRFNDKSVEQFLARHYVLICLLGPILVVIVSLSFYFQYYSRELTRLCKCQQICGRFSCSDRTPQPKVKRVAQAAKAEAEAERNDRIRNRKKTPAPKRQDSESPKKQQRARKSSASKSPVKRRATSPAKKSKKSLEAKAE